MFLCFQVPLFGGAGHNSSCEIMISHLLDVCSSHRGAPGVRYSCLSYWLSFCVATVCHGVCASAFPLFVMQCSRCATLHAVLL